jgi:NAD-dependent SIR2 family protein deacetylase
MGLNQDPRVPEEAKWALNARHMHNMRYAFEPNQGYKTLLDLVKDKDFFVLTSNVDGCFERSGFPKDRMYSPG